MEDLDEYFEETEYNARINESDPIKEKETNEIYSYTIFDDEEVKSIHIISSCSSKNFEDTMANMDFELLLTSMNEGLTKEV